VFRIWIFKKLNYLYELVLTIGLFLFEFVNCTDVEKILLL